jgi:magnesium chelatase family protein
MNSRVLSSSILGIDAYIVEVPAVPFTELADKEAGEKSDRIRLRCQNAREIQLERFSKISGMFTNAQMESNELRKFCGFDKQSSMLLKTAMEKLGLSARAYDRILKVSRTIADLAGEKAIKSEHLSEAIQYRSLDRQLWLE